MALMCLAEALLRVPDAGHHRRADRGQDRARRLGPRTSASPPRSLVNASTWALIADRPGAGRRRRGPGRLAARLRATARRAGDPRRRRAGDAQDGQAVRARPRPSTRRCAAPPATRPRATPIPTTCWARRRRTDADAARYPAAYADAIAAIAAALPVRRRRATIPASRSSSRRCIRATRSPRRARCMAELVPARRRPRAAAAQGADMGFNIDAEEADRLDLSLDVIEAVLADPALAGWDGFGVVVQAYGQRAPAGDRLAGRAGRRSLDRRIMVRLVKGAYWDTEIKRAQVAGPARISRCSPARRRPTSATSPLPASCLA